mmetsp:Transcript_71267/g.192708  ORF Transcript_71267/g.192708 Transcript_71267/m.192708 type:complete len:210 (+) Transcript_71267:309-938(+)
MEVFWDRSARGRNRNHFWYIISLGRASARAHNLLVDLLDDLVGLPSVNSGIGLVAAACKNPDHPRVLVREGPNLLHAPILLLQPLPEQEAQRAIAERVAVFPQKVIRSRHKVRVQVLYHGGAGHLRVAHVNYRWPPAEGDMAGNALELVNAPAAEGELHVVHEDRGVVSLEHLRHRRPDGTRYKLHPPLPALLAVLPGRRLAPVGRAHC